MRYPKVNYSPEEPFPAYAAMVRQEYKKKYTVIKKKRWLTYFSFVFLEIYHYIMEKLLHQSNCTHL